MITLYTWTTPNGRKASIMLEEVGLPYEVRPVNIGADEQFAPEFLKVSPNNKIPAIVDDAPQEGDPVSVFESGAILQYLAEKTGRLLAPSGPARVAALEWTYWQVGGLGPMLGQLGYFAHRAPDKHEPSIARFRDEGNRLLDVMERRLGEAEYLAGADYSIADIACYAWASASQRMLRATLGATERPGVARWLEAVGARPAVQRGMEVPKV